MKVFNVGEYHGAPVLRRQVGELDFAVTVREGGTTVPVHCHALASFIVLLRGEHFWVSEEGKIKWTVPGVWYYRPAMFPHSHESCATQIKSLGVHFPPGAVPEIESEDDNIVLDHAIGRTLASEIVCELESPDAASGQVLQSAFHRLAAGFVRHGRHVTDQNVSQWLAEARQWLDERSLQGVTLRACADAVGSHPSHLARAFRAAYGQTVGDYVRDRRLEWAFDQLAKHDKKVSEIALAAGFSDHAHFSRVFKQRYGKSPSEFRTGV